MKKYMVYIITFILFLGLVIYIFNNNLKLYSKDLFYMDTVINIKFYCESEHKANMILEHVEDMYREYHQLTDRYNDYGINNVYYINNNKDSIKEIQLDSRLYEMISYAYNFPSDLFDINMGGVIDLWKEYRESGNGVPSNSELKKANKRNDIVLLGDNKILNNHPNIDLGGISKGYTTSLVGSYLKTSGIKYYLINAGGNVLAGDSYRKDYYKIGIQNPSQSGISYVLNASNVSVVTSGGYERNYVYDGVIYHHIISPITLFPTNYMQSVTIVTPDSALGDILSTTLFLMDIDSGKEFIKNYDAEALWIDNDGNVIKSEGFGRYEQK